MSEAELREAIWWALRKAAWACARAVIRHYTRARLRQRFGSPAGGGGSRSLPQR
ncbi:hypothetical protein [Streptomyces sp. NPDC127066]|uniref:hypothetical protein n=1 Tax=Streptomyces sp. NPDC127066 TaxID=3347125 RepID=UPI0036687BBF